MHARHWLAAGMAIAALAAPAVADADDAGAVFQSRYGELRGALLARDAAAARAILAPGYELTDIRGEVQDAAAMLERNSRTPSDPARKTDTAVLSATVNGALATVEQRMTASTTRAGADGVAHLMELELVSVDTWVKQGDTWLLWRSAQKNLTARRDGEVFLTQQN